MHRRHFLSSAGLLSTGAVLAVTIPGSLAWAQAPAAAPPQVTAASVAQDVQRFYDLAKTYRSVFKQRYYIYAYNRSMDSRGTVIFQKPGKMRWEYSNNGNVVVSNGKELKVYESENKQMYLQSVDKNQYPAALSFLLGNGKLTKEFDLALLDSTKLKYPSGHVLLGTPKTPTPAYQKILFYVDGPTKQVRRVLLIDAQRNRNRFDFENASINEPVKPETFLYTPPKGTRVVRP